MFKKSFLVCWLRFDVEVERLISIKMASACHAVLARLFISLQTECESTCLCVSVFVFMFFVCMLVC